MEEPKDKPDVPKTPEPGEPLLCTCVKDLFSDLPPELRPHQRSWNDGFRKVTCPGCGLQYWTNRKTNLCVDCEEKGVRQPGG